MIWVPAFAAELSLWPAVVMVAAYWFATRNWRMATVLIAYVIPDVFSAPWPTHCFTGFAIWLILRRPGKQAAPVPPAGSVRPNAWRTTSTALCLGLVSGIIVVLLDYQNIVVDPWWLPMERPHTAMIIATVTVVAAANAIGEELWWRTVLLVNHTGITAAAQYTFQATTFGIAHLHGIPSGMTGVLAAGVYSLLCVWVYRRWGWRHCALTHVVTDLVVFGAIACWARFAFS